MRKRHFRFPAFFLALVLFFSVFFGAGFDFCEKKTAPITAGALTYVGNCGENCKWKLDLKSGTLTVSGTGNIKNYDDGVEPIWLKNKDGIKSIVVTAGIKRIGNYAFARLNSVKKVTFSQSVTAVGDSAFYGCSDLVELNASSPCILTIGENAFAYCRKLSKLPYFPKLKTIGANAFLYCYSLSEISLAYSVKSIGRNAFDGCRLLKKIRIVNYKCDITDSAGTIYKPAVIECFKSSTARTYADKYSRKVAIIKDIKYLNDLKIKLEYNTTSYNGKKKNPKVKIKGLKKGRDFNVKYADNIEVGEASVTVSAAGKTLGAKKLKFIINPAKVKDISLTSDKAELLSFTWKKVHGANKYEIYMQNGKKWVKKATVSKNSYTLKGLSPKTEYSFRVRAVNDSKKVRYAGKFSETFKATTAKAAKKK